MKQIIQNYKTGELQLVEVPVPALKKGFVLVRNINSLVSVGTEKYILEMAKKSFFGKALARPDLVKQLIAKLKTEGIMETYRAVMARLDSPVPLGYSCAGTVEDVTPVEYASHSPGQEFKIGDRVSCAGSGYASHAEVVYVPINLCVKIPDSVDFESASFVTLGGIALQAIRMANPSLGDKVVVIGLGLLGQITVQLLKSAGCHVFGIDISEDKVKMAIENGCDGAAVSRKIDVISYARQFAPQGFDSVIIMAATESNEPLEMAAEIARERGKIVASGLVGLKIPRKIFFEKELDFIVSRAWGPGVFDPDYFEKNIDYPYPYARWTARRNMEEFLLQVAKGNVNVKKLITHRFKIEEAIKAYDLILKGKEPYMGVIIEYSERSDRSEVIGDRIIRVSKPKAHYPLAISQHLQPTIGMIGAGLFAKGTILPILKKMEDVKLKGVATTTGYKAHHVAGKFGFEYFTTDYREILNDKDINLVFIMTRHGSHAHFVTEALKAGKHVFVEKPLCINESQLHEIISVYNKIRQSNQTNKITGTNKTYDKKQTNETNQIAQILMVGFNRRFALTTRFLLERLAHVERPLMATVRVNVGYIPQESWVYDPEEGGGNIIGEACHFVDLIQALTSSVPVEVFARAVKATSGAVIPEDNVTITLTMTDGNVGTIIYTAQGNKSYQRERVEAFGGGAVAIIENFKKAIWSQAGMRKKFGTFLSGVDRGHRAEMETLIRAIRSAEPFPVAFESYVATMRATFGAIESLRTGKSVKINR